MIIECSECQARFKLADEKVKPEGTKVRCSKCKHVFTVTPPAPEPAVAPEAQPEPPPAPAAETAAAPAAATGADEQDDEFSFDFDDDTVSDDAADDFDLGTSDDSAFDFDEEDDSAPVSAPATGDDEGGPTEFSFDEEEGGGFDFGFEEEEDDSAAASAPTAGDDEGGPTEFSFDEEESGGFDFGFDEEEDDSAAAPAPTGGGDEGGPAEFSFGEEDTSSGIETDTPQTAAEAADDEVDEFADLREDTLPPGAEYDEKRSRPEPQEPPPPRKSAVGTFFKLLLLLILLGVGGACGYFYWVDGTIDIAKIEQRIRVLIGQATPAEEKPRIGLDKLNGFFVDNPSEGQMFVIEGEATNKYPDARSSLAVKGVLYGSGGQVLRYTTAYCGNPISPQELQSLSWDKIKEKMSNPFGESLINSDVPPGKTLAFTIVFKKLPDNLAEFSVEPLKAEK